MITNHGFLENPTFRGMRFHLLESFDSIYVLDLHGNTTKGESSPNNIRDSNVFDIQQGVSVAIMVRTSDKARQRKRGADNKIPPARLRHAELWGSRSEKSEALHNGILAGGPWADLTPSSPYYFFVPKDLALQDQYGAGFSITDLMPEKVTGVITARDRLALDFDDVAQAKKLRRFADTTRSDAEVRTEFFKDKTSPKSGDTRGWNMSEARKTLAKLDPRTLLRSIAYRPFDQRSIAYTPLLVDWGREAFMRHLLERPNLALVTCRQGLERLGTMRLSPTPLETIVTSQIDRESVATTSALSYWKWRPSCLKGRCKPRPQTLRSNLQDCRNQPKRPGWA